MEVGKYAREQAKKPAVLNRQFGEDPLLKDYTLADRYNSSLLILGMESDLIMCLNP